MSSNDSTGNAGNNLWFHPVLLSLMEGRPVQEDLAIQYIQENATTIASQIKTLMENNLDMLAVQIAEWCMKVPTLQMDVNVVSNLLFVLNKLGRSEDFHRQCCQLPCCLAKEVMKVMEQSSFQVAVLRIASEIFLLQDLLNPSVSCCTKDLLNFWLSIQKEENLTNDLIVENVNKMLGIVEEFGTLCTFVEVIFNVFSARFLPLCTDLSLRIFQSQKPLVGSLSYLGTSNCVRLVQTIEIIGKLFRNFTPLYSECLLTSLTLDPSLPRYILTLNFFLGRTSGVPVSACKMLPVDIKVYNSVLQTVGQLRPIQLDRQQSWAHLRQSIIAHLAHNGYSLDLSGSAFVRTVNSVSDEVELHRRLMAREEQEANLMPAANISATSKFGAIQPPKPRSTANKPGSRRQGAVNRGQKKMLNAAIQQQSIITSMSASAITSNVAGNVTIANSTMSYQNYQFQPPESQCMVAILPQVPVISGSSELMPIVVDHDLTKASELQNFNQIKQVAKSQEVTLSEKCAKAHNSTLVVDNSRESNVSAESSISTSNVRIGRSQKMARTPSRTSPRRPQSNSIDSRSNSRGIKYEDDNSADTNSISRRLRARGAQSESGSALDSFDSKLSNKPEEGKPRRGRPPKISKANGSCTSEVVGSFFIPKENAEASISNGLKNIHVKKLKSFSASKSSFFNIKKYKRQNKQRHMWLKNHKKLVTSVIRKMDLSLLQKKRGRPLNSTDLPNCFVSLPKLSSSEVIGKRIVRKRKAEDSDPELEEPPYKKVVNKKIQEKQKPKNITDSSGKLLMPMSESAINPCVCDGCGEVVPDCNWLTAHIVVCPGMTGGGGEEEAESMIVSSEGAWDQSKLEQQQQAAVVQEGEGFIQQTSFVEYPVNPAGNQTVNENHNFENFAGQDSYVIAPQNPIMFGKEIEVDGISAFEFSVHRCSHCFMVFYTEASLVTHLKNSDHFYSSGIKYEVYVCSKCALHFLEKSTLWFHSQYSCGKSMTGTISSAERETYKCWICHKDFLSDLFLARHILGKHASDSVAFQCLHQQIQQHKKQQAQYQGQYQVAKNPPNYSNLVGTDGTAIAVQNVSRVSANQASQSIVGTAGQSQLTTIDTTQISADFYQQATCDLYQSSANLLYSQSDSFQQNGSQRILTQPNGYFQQPQQQQQQEFSTVSVLPISMSENQDVFYGMSSQPSIINSTRVQTQGDTYASASCSNENAGIVTISSAPGGSGGGAGMRRAAKGIMYKNVYMQCVVNYHCSHCKTDLSTKALKKEHRRSACFDANSNRFSYLRQYSYLCPYCGEKFPSQKVCRQHQLSVCLVLMGVKTDELNFKQHNCPFCNKKYFNVITLKGHLTLAHKDRVDSTECGAQDADDGGNDDLIGGVGGKYSNLIVNNPLVPIPNLEAGPVFSSLATSPLKVALQQQQQLQQQPLPIQIVPVVENSVVPTEENACMPVAQVSEPAVIDAPSQMTTSAIKSRNKKKSHGKSPVTPQTSGTSIASTRSLRNNPRSSRYHYDDDFCSGEDLDVFEPKLSRSISERSDRQTRSSMRCEKEDGKCNKSDSKNGENTVRHVGVEEDADSDATDDLTVDESAADSTFNDGHRQSDGSNPFAELQQVNPHHETDGSSLTTSLFPDLASSSVDQVMREGIDPTTFIEQMASSNQNQHYASLQPLESNQASTDTRRSSSSPGDEVQVENENYQGNAIASNKSSNNKFIIDNLLGYSTPPDSKHNLRKKPQERDCGSDDDGQEDFLINIDSSLDVPADEDDDDDDDDESKGSSGTGSVQNKPIENSSCSLPSNHKEKQTKIERPRSLKQEQPNLFSITYEKSSRQDRREDTSPLINRVQSNSSVEHRLDSEDCSSVSPEVSEISGQLSGKDLDNYDDDDDDDDDPGRVGSGIVMDVKKRTILKKLSNSLNMASKRQPSAVGGAKVYK